MSSTDNTDPIETRLMNLIDRGYRFIHPRDEHGTVIAVVGVRAHGAVIDILRLDAEDDATAFRVPGHEHDIFTPSTMLWRRRGAAHEVLDELLALPEEHPTSTSHPSPGSWAPSALPEGLTIAS
jgi:hypothetical protein